MVKNWHRWVWGVLLIVLFILWGLCFITLREFKTLWISLGVFNLTLLSVFVFPYKKDFFYLLKHKTLKRSGAELISFLLILAIVGVINFIGIRTKIIKDFSQDGLNTLSDQSVQVVKMIQSPLKLTLFAPQAEWNQLLSFLNLYSYQQPLIKLKAIDLEAEPVLAKKAGINLAGQVLIEYEGKKEIILLEDELSMVNGVLKVLSFRKTKAFFISGHQELDCQSTEPQGGSHLCEELKKNFSSTETLNLVQTKSIPETADALFILNPQADFLDQELNKIQTYLEKGGSLLIGYSPILKAGLLPGLNGLIKKWGIELTPSLVIDRASSLDGQEATIPIVDQYSSQHPLVRKFKARTLFPLVSALKISNPLYENVAIHELVQTSTFPGSFAETNFKALEVGQANYKDKEDLPGPLTLVAVAERLSTDVDHMDTRIAVVGSGLIFTNVYSGQVGNLDLMINISKWLVHEEGLISLNRPQTKKTPIILSALHLHAIFYLAIVIIPLLFGLSAIFIFWRRSKW
jgi:ABC-type uncharacterized transport system involved in gliding motility auxiliary subunit